MASSIWIRSQYRVQGFFDFCAELRQLNGEGAGVGEGKFEAVIFDVDGLIVDSEALYCETFSETLGDYGAEMSREDYTVCVGHPVADNCVYAVDKYKLDTTPEVFDEVWMGRFEVAISDPERVVLMPGFMDLLGDLREQPLKLGIASSTERPRIEKTLNNGLLSRLDGISDLSEIFGAILSGSDVKQVKPDPEIYLLTAEGLDVDPSACVVFEDSEAGVWAAKAAGMTAVAVPNFFTSHQDHRMADEVVKSLEVVRVTCSELRVGKEARGRVKGFPGPE
jgi:beta-phosphoglucomutase-like phosphatase (HAD superfamily)